MPYVICSECQVTTYSAALWSGTDECPSCGGRLPVARRHGVLSLSTQAGMVGAPATPPPAPPPH